MNIRCQFVALAAAGLLLVGSLQAQDDAQAPKANANQAGAKKVPLKEASSNEALAVYGDAANFQNNGAFELAVDEWKKFLKQFPDDPLAPKANHYLGICSLQLQKLPEAAAAFQDTIARYEKFELTEDAWLNLGWCQFTLAGGGKPELFPQAVATFTSLLKDYPQSKYLDQALFFRGESQVALDKRDLALADYQRLVKEFPESDLRCDGLYALGVTHEELRQYAEAGKVYDQFLKSCADSELVTEVRMRKAETILQAGDFAAAEQQFAEVAAVPDFASADHALFRRAFCLARLDKFPEAAQLYAGLVQKFPDSVYLADSRMSAGRCFYRAEQLEEAAQWFARVIEQQGEDLGEAAHWSARILLKQNQPLKALELVEKALPKSQDSEFLVNLQMDQADALYEIPERRGDAVTHYARIASEHPQHAEAPQALYNAAFTALELKQFDAALQHATAFTKAYAESPLLADVRYIAAETQLQQGDHAQADAAYKAVIESYPNHPDVELWQVRRALALYLQKNYAGVVSEFAQRAAGMQAPDNKAEALFLVGASQFYLDQFDAAARSLSAALAAQPKWRQADETLLYLSRAQRKQNQLTEALATVKRLVEGFPDSSLLDQAHFRWGETSYAAEDYATAAAQYGQVIEKWPTSVYVPYAQYGRGWSLLKQKQYEPASNAFSSLLTGSPQHTLAADARFARAMCRRQLDQHQQALEDLAAYLESQPELAGKSDALYEQGLSQVALKEFQAAAATFEMLLKENPRYAANDKVLYELGWAHKSRQQDEPAVQAFRRLTEQYPDSPLAAEASFHVGEQLYDQKQYAEAAQAYTRAAERAQVESLAEKSLYKLGWAHFQQKQYDGALAQFEKQLQQHPQGGLRPDGQFMKAECLFRLEKYGEALPAFEQTQQLELSSPVLTTLALLHGGQSAAQTRQWDKSVAMATTLLEKFPESPYQPQALYDLAWAKQNQGQTDEALKVYEQAATRSRGEVGARARFMIGELRFAAKEYAEAIREFQRVMFGFGGDQAAAEVKSWQAKSGFEAGRCAEVQLKDASDPQRKAELLEEARKAYGYVVERHPQSELVGQAKMRLQALAKL